MRQNSSITDGLVDHAGPEALQWQIQTHVRRVAVLHPLLMYAAPRFSAVMIPLQLLKCWDVRDELTTSWDRLGILPGVEWGP